MSGSAASTGLEFHKKSKSFQPGLIVPDVLFQGQHWEHGPMRAVGASSLGLDRLFFRKTGRKYEAKSFWNMSECQQQQLVVLDIFSLAFGHDLVYLVQENRFFLF